METGHAQKGTHLPGLLQVPEGLVPPRLPTNAGGILEECLHPWHSVRMKTVIRTFFRALRAVLTPFLLLGEKLTTPKSMERDPVEQQRVDAETRNMALYQFVACPFCIMARRGIRRLGLNIELRDAQLDPEHRRTLLEGGGKVQVPCLRIDHADGHTQWMYESSDIVRYLEQRFRT